MKNRGFTLLETLVAIGLASVIAAIVFSAWTRARENENRLENRIQQEFRLYRTMSAVSEVLGGMSRTLVVHKGRELRPYFAGSGRSMTFLTRDPLLASVPGLHLFRLEWNGESFLTWEKRYDRKGSAESLDMSFSKKGNIILTGISSCRFSYRVWDHQARKWTWKDELSSASPVLLPSRIAVDLHWQNQNRRFEFTRRLIDEDEEIPPSRIP